MSGRTPSLAAPRIRLEPALLEAAVDLLLAGPAAEEQRYQRFRRAADRLYALHETPEARRAAFHLLYSGLFEDLGCAAVLGEALAGLAGRVDEVLVARAMTPAEEGAELGADGRTAGLRIAPARFAQTADLRRFIRHECAHLVDMLDPAFAYGIGAPGVGERVRRLVGERFGCLWDCSVDGRAARAGTDPLRRREDLEEECARLYPSLTGETVTGVVRRLWEGERPTYGTLVEWAGNPAALATWAGFAAEAGDGAAGPAPGAACPLCGFPTYDWASGITEPTADLIRQDFPGWQIREGACGRCVEAYQVREAAASGPAVS